MDIRANPHYKEQLIKIKFTAGYDLKSKFKLELEMPPSSTGTNHIGTFEAEYPLTRVPKNLFRRLFMSEFLTPPLPPAMLVLAAI